MPWLLSGARVATHPTIQSLAFSECKWQLAASMALQCSEPTTHNWQLSCWTHQNLSLKETAVDYLAQLKISCCTNREAIHWSHHPPRYPDIETEGYRHLLRKELLRTSCSCAPAMCQVTHDLFCFPIPASSEQNATNIKNSIRLL